MAEGANFTCIMPSKLALVTLFLATSCVWAQSAGHTGQKSAPTNAPVEGLPRDPGQLIQAIRGSYYHPDGLELIDCDVSVNWSGDNGRMSVRVPEERQRLLKGLQVHTRAVRGQPVAVRFDWTEGAPEKQNEIESGIKKMVNGFYRTYWGVIASPMVKANERVENVVRLPDGGIKTSASRSGVTLAFVANPDGTPNRIDITATGAKVGINFSYMPSPHPVPGDLRRVVGVLVAEEVGTTTAQQQLKLDYQDVNGFSIPHKVSLGVVGVYAVDFEFSECKASTFAVSE